MIVHQAYENGTIRNHAGELIAFYDAQVKQLTINGFALTFPAQDIEQAMEIVGRRVPGPRLSVTERRAEMVNRFVSEMNCSRATAQEYLEAEGWIYYEAQYSLKADRQSA